MTRVDAYFRTHVFVYFVWVTYHLLQLRDTIEQQIALRWRLYQIILEPIFASSSPHECMLAYIFVRTFSCARVDLRKARECELETLDETSTISEIAEPMLDKVEGNNQGREETTPVATACSGALK